MGKGPRIDAATASAAKQAVAAGPGIGVASGAADGEPGAEIPAAEFRKRLQAWYRKHARELPWRGTQDPYETWLSEIMLQQTRVATVIDRYGEFLRRFPTLSILARAQENDVLALWSGLGYYRRARMLHRCAQFVEREMEGRLPQTCVELRTLPGVGEYTAAAIASISFGESVAVVDGNVERVLLRLMGFPEERNSKGRARVARAAQDLVPAAAKRAAGRPSRSNPPGDHNQAMMELGATICLPKAPLCLQCPVFDFCRTRGVHPTPPREPQQSRIVAHLLALRKAGTATEVLLERRSEMASLMPGMLELPALPLESVRGREPVLRVRHSITNTNYYAQIFTEGAVGVSATDGAAGELEAEPGDGRGRGSEPPAAAPESHGMRGKSRVEDEVFVASSLTAAEAEKKLDDTPSLVDEIPASLADLQWTPTARLRDIPLTGLARKVLQRLGVMAVPELRIG